MPKRQIRTASTIALAALTALAFASSGCSSYLHRQFREGAKTQVESTDYSLHFIEADDEGWFWEPRQATAAIELVHRKVAERNTIVLVFVHGWHHSAQCCDDDVEGFKETLIRLGRQLQRPAHAAVQSKEPEAAGAQRDINVVGIYIGWRGRSLPGPLDYFSFWGRKSSAERVGNTDFSEFLSRLNEVYLQYNPRGQEQQARTVTPASPEHFLGLVTIGHSFGGQVLLKAVSATLEDQLLHKNPAPGYLRNSRPAAPRTGTTAIRGVGDLLVLLNPAAEAAQYHRLHVLSQGLEYPPEQTPVMLTVSAENDRPRHKLFTLGRMLGEFFTGKPRKHDPMEREVERKALGVYDEHITHRLEPTDSTMRLVPTRIEHPREPGCEGDAPCACDFYEWQSEPAVTVPNSITAGSPTRLRDFDFSGPLVFDDVQLVPKNRAIPHQPFIVAEASRAVIDGHNGIFTAPFLEFLVSYIAFVETKNAELR